MAFLVEPDNPEKFAELIETILKNSNQLKELGNYAKKLSISKFDRNQLTQKWIDFILK